jgi:hypothetical protein
VTASVAAVSMFVIVLVAALFGTVWVAVTV